MKNTWKLSSFDTFCIGMNIKSAWIYKEAPDINKMKAALDMNCPGNGTKLMNS